MRSRPKQSRLPPTTRLNNGKIIDLSKQKWDWMANKNVDSLSVLFDDKSMFIHMGGTWGKTQEISTIKSGGIWYKKAEVYNVCGNMFGNTAILLNDIDLVAVVGGRGSNKSLYGDRGLHQGKGQMENGLAHVLASDEASKLNNANNNQQPQH